MLYAHGEQKKIVSTTYEKQQNCLGRVSIWQIIIIESNSYMNYSIDLNVKCMRIIGS